MMFIVTRWEREADIKGTILNINIKSFTGQKGPRLWFSKGFIDDARANPKGKQMQRINKTFTRASTPQFLLLLIMFERLFSQI